MMGIPAADTVNLYWNTHDMVFERSLLPKSSDGKSEPAKASESAGMAVENESKILCHACSDPAGLL